MSSRDPLALGLGLALGGVLIGLLSGCAAPTPIGYVDDRSASSAGAGGGPGSGGGGGALGGGGAGGASVTVGSGGGHVDYDLYVLAAPPPPDTQHLYKFDPEDLGKAPLDLGRIDCAPNGTQTFLADIAVDEQLGFYGITLAELGTQYEMVRLHPQDDGTLGCEVLGLVDGIYDAQLYDAPLAMAPPSVAGAQGVILLGPGGDLFAVDTTTLALQAVGHIPPGNTSFSLDLTLVDNDGAPMGFAVSNGNVAAGPVVTAPHLYQFEPLPMGSGNALLGTIDRGAFHDKGGCAITWQPWDLNNGGLVAYEDKIIGFFTDNMQPGLSVYEVDTADASVCITYNDPDLHPYGAAMISSVPFIPPPK